MLLIDTLMLVRRCYAKMDFLKNSAGRPTGMEYGTLRVLEGLQKKYPDQRVVMCLDSTSSWRRDRCLTYKANRTKVLDGSYHSRLKSLMKVLRSEYCHSGKDGYEADDVMMSLSRANDGPHYLYTNDHDLLQAITEKVRVVRSFKSKLFEWDVDRVLKEYGLPPEYLAEYQAFVGDKSDNVVGVPRIIKNFLVDLIDWAHENDLSQREMLAEIRTAAWPPKLMRRVSDFLDAGTWALNYELIKLAVVPGVVVTESTRDNGYVAGKMREWEIYSLELSTRHGVVRPTDNEEF